MEIDFRSGEIDDSIYDQFGLVMYEAVHNSPNSPYSSAQRQAWVPTVRTATQMRPRLEDQSVFYACCGEKVAGYLTLRKDGYLDMAFVHPDFQQKFGIFGQLIGRLIQHAKSSGLEKLTTHASLSAQPAFSKYGFQIDCKESVQAGDQKLDRYAMHLLLK